MTWFMVPLLLFVVWATIFSLSEGQNLSAVAEASNKVALQLHERLAVKEDGNIFISNIGISSALAMLYDGSRGKTAEELRRVLVFQEAGLADNQVHAAFKNFIETISQDSSGKKYHLCLSNAVLIGKDHPILPEYKNSVLEKYKSPVRNVDFQTLVRDVGNIGTKTVEEISDCAKMKTDNQIEKLLGGVDLNTIMVLMSAAYFKGTWKTRFNTENTTKQVFFNKGLQNEQTRVEMMHLVEDLRYIRFAESRVLELPYEGDDIVMLLLLPDAMAGAYKFEHELSPSTAMNMFKGVRKVKIHVSLPKFKLGDETTLNTAFEEIGIKNIFENSADLSGISKAGPLAVSKVIHKVAVEVNEEGSEASGVLTETRTGGEDNEFIFDRPFLSVILDKRNGIIYFQARISEL